ncbi:MAG TPA: aldo/keto reductase [Phycisphaerae bacterium]|nr:aldo/keto reductase [Phycisphaerae bacterium]
MKYRVLGKTGLRVSVIGMGTWQLGGEWGKEFEQGEVTGMIGRAHEVGINLIDTAECYGDHESERLIGGALKELGLRGDFVIATKFGHKFEGNFRRTEPRTGKDVEKQLEDSLRALGTDHIDLYQYHSVRESEFFAEDVREVLRKAKQAGKVVHIGNSIGGGAKTAAQVEASVKMEVEAVQVVYNRLSRGAEDLFFPVCERLGLGVLARVPLASGFLSGKYKPGAVFGGNDVRGAMMKEGAEERLREVERIGREEVPAGVSMAQWALAWCLRSPAVQCVIPGCKSVGQVEANAAAGEMVEGKHPWAAR